MFIGWTDAEAETPIFCPPDAKYCSFEVTLMLGKIEGRRRRGRQSMRWLDGTQRKPVRSSKDPVQSEIKKEVHLPGGDSSVLSPTPPPTKRGFPSHSLWSSEAGEDSRKHANTKNSHH